MNKGMRAECSQRVSPPTPRSPAAPQNEKWYSSQKPLRWPGGRVRSTLACASTAPFAPRQMSQK
eukprot:6552360-Alexandrium_andersonii.AAC.1